LLRRGSIGTAKICRNGARPARVTPILRRQLRVGRTGTRNEKDGIMSLGLILVIILVIFLLGGFSGRFGGYGYGYGHGGIGVIGIIIIVLVVLLLMGRL
jgi:hypothetical protein